jgi:hypothetical protein
MRHISEVLRLVAHGIRSSITGVPGRRETLDDGLECGAVSGRWDLCHAPLDSCGAWLRQGRLVYGPGRARWPRHPLDRKSRSYPEWAFFTSVLGGSGGCC